MAKLRKTLPAEFVEFIRTKREMRAPYSQEDIEKCKELLKDCEPDATERGGLKRTALHMSIPIEVARWLIERGANVNAENRYGTTLREQAGMRYPNIDICKLLIDNGAEVDAVNYSDETPLFGAADMGNVEIVKLLLEHGADPYHRNWKLEDYNTPLGYMIERLEPHDVEGKADVAEILINAMGGKERIPAEDWSRAQKNIRHAGKVFEFRKSGWSAEDCETTQAVMDRLYSLFEVAPPQEIVRHDGVSPIIVDTSLPVLKIHDALWEYLVPSFGKCETVQGEVIRISGKIADEVCRNGGVNWGREYGILMYWLMAHLRKGTTLEASDIDKAGAAVTAISDSRGCCCEKDAETLQELAVKWVSLNSTPIPLGDVLYNG